MSELAVATSGNLRAVRGQRISIVILLCFVVIAAVAVAAALGSWITPHAPGQQDLSLGLAKPSGEHWLGTDALGRDVFSRIIVGARSAFLGPAAIAIGAATFGSLLGLLAGYYGGITDALISRWIDLMWALPGLLIIIVVAGAFGGDYWFSVALLVILTTPYDARLVRAATLEQRPRPYVEAAEALGFSDLRIMVVHIWPNVSSVVAANLFLDFATSLVALSGLSFLGLGLAPGTPDWGLMLAEGRNLLFANPVAILAPATMIVLTATCMNLLGDWLFERLTSRGATR
jgi:peptide/nickel transport system permease protein